MRKLAVLTLLFFISYGLLAQKSEYALKKGALLILGEPSGPAYTNIDFPKKNIIMKRGAIPNFKALIGKKLVVEEIHRSPEDIDIVTLVRHDGRKFFRFFSKVEANLSKAIESGELHLSE